MTVGDNERYPRQRKTTTTSFYPDLVSSLDAGDGGRHLLPWRCETHQVAWQQRIMLESDPLPIYFTRNLPTPAAFCSDQQTGAQLRKKKCNSSAQHPKDAKEPNLIFHLSSISSDRTIESNLLLGCNNS